MATLTSPGLWMLEQGLAGQAVNLLEKQQQAKKKKKKAEARGLGFSSGVFLYHSIFLPTDPQMSMAATAAVSPSDYLQPAAATTQASAQWTARAGARAWLDC